MKIINGTLLAAVMIVGAGCVSSVQKNTEISASECLRANHNVALNENAVRLSLAGRAQAAAILSFANDSSIAPEENAGMRLLVFRQSS